ncbi:SpoIVB peptidase [Paenactinomyces guangxiensis]|uniref:SpoIVB peptidase n=1 Tax=Paenactinomyces guangxiensis TaxID=1490290 RepID=A0A7W1WS12_9BACL|nr:SpoIVB peptidase [Paenactinomyces guangxiensis]MBA4495009.1 SpoIVB peptidase [Paenactinomyces guangxiensis]MBH8592092.1 SpoIVB peptidase [Paenactinomyces guangxiensis]
MLQRAKKQKWIGFLLVLLLLMGSTTTTFRQFTGFPAEVRLFQGQLQKLHLIMPVSATASVSNPDVIQINGSNQLQVPVDLHHPVTLLSHATGKTLLTLKLFGTLPIKKVNVSVYPDIKVVPGGQSIGVKLKTSGVLVVGHHLVHAENEDKSPAEKADIRVGDYLTRINGKAITQVSDVVEAVAKAGKTRQPLQMTLLRDGREKQVTLHPLFDKRENLYRLGIYIRDSAAGVGTLTFYDPKGKVYGALGHVISDMDTGKPITVGKGKIIQSNVTSIQKGESGEPGEKRAIFLQEDQVLGNITRNTPFGIFGKMEKVPAMETPAQPIPVALAEQVKEGPAKILTVVEGQKVEAFNIQIVHVLRQKFPATKGLIIKVTDSRLLDKTGGIVQGMSGSPIIQDGKLVGAVTHVFVNDPTSGYGTFIEWMLQDAGVFPSAGPLKGSAFFAL